MDAMDLNWCLTCNRHFDSDGTAPYCSRQCFASDQPSPSSLYSSPRPSPFDAAEESISDFDDLDDYSRHGGSVPVSERSRWIGRGDVGISEWARDVPPGPPSQTDSVSPAQLKPPKLLLSHRRPVPPTLCMSKTTSVPPPPSHPIRTPQPSFQSRSSQCPTDASASYTTPSSSVLATPRSDDTPLHPNVPPPKQGLLDALTAHFRSWAIISQPKHFPRSQTITRDSHSGSIVPPPLPHRQRVLSVLVHDDHDYFAYSDVKSQHEAEADETWPSAPFEKLEPELQESESWQAILDADHPAFHARGRRSTRVAS